MGAVNPNRFTKFFDQKIEVQMQGKSKRVTRTLVEPTAKLWGVINDDLIRAKYEPLPGELNQLTQEDVAAHLAKVYGKILADEIAADPDRLGYAKAKNDEEIAQLMNARRSGAEWRPMKWLFQLAPGTGPTVGPQLNLVPEANQDERVPLFSRLNDFDKTAIRFFKHTVSEGFRNRRVPVSFWTDATANLESPLPAPMQPSDLVYIETLRGKLLRPRKNVILRFLPHAPNNITAEDIALAKKA